MRARRNNLVVIATLVGLLAVAAFGGWYLVLGAPDAGVRKIEIPARPVVGQKDSWRHRSSESLE